MRYSTGNSDIVQGTSGPAPLTTLDSAHAPVAAAARSVPVGMAPRTVGAVASPASGASTPFATSSPRNSAQSPARLPAQQAQFEPSSPARWPRRQAMRWNSAQWHALSMHLIDSVYTRRTQSPGCLLGNWHSAAAAQVQDQRWRRGEHGLCDLMVCSRQVCQCPCCLERRHRR